MPDSNASDVLVATETFAMQYEGEWITVVAGKTHVRVGHPIANGNPNRFAPVEVHYDIETARQEPVPPPPAPNPATAKKAAAPRRDR